MYVLHFVDINEVHLAISDELTFTEAMIDENRKEQVVLGHLSGIQCTFKFTSFNRCAINVKFI